MTGTGSSPGTILSNVGWLALAEALGRLLTFVALMHLTRALGPEPLGMVEFGLSLFALLALVALGGIEVLAKRQVARTPRGIGRVAGVTLVVGWGWLFLAAVGLGAVAPWIDRPAPTLTVAAGFAAAALLAPLTLRFAFLGRERMGRLAAANIAGQAIWALSVLTLVDSPDDVVLVPALWFAGEAARVCVLLFAYRALFGRIRWPRPLALRTWAAASVPVGLGRIARGSLYVVDVFILGLLAPLAVVGLYGVALRLPLFLVSIAARVHQAVFPSVARLVPAGDATGLGRLQGLSARAALSLGLAAALTLGASGGSWMAVLFGEPWRASAVFLAVLVWKVPLAALSGLYRNVLWAARPAHEARISLAGAAATVVVAVLATLGFGAMGCAVAMVLGEALLLGLYLRGARGHAHGFEVPDKSWAALQAIALVGIAGWWLWLPAAGDVRIIVSSVLVGVAAGLLPLLPTLPALIRTLRAR